MNQPSKSLIKLDKVTKTYGEGVNAFQALKGVDLEIEKGDFVAITGPSGSGKSTLMNILGALDKPTEGKYFLKGQDIGQLNNNKLAEYRNKEVGFVFQQFNLLSRTSVFDNVALPGIYGQLDQLDNRVLEVLSQVGLADKAQNKPNEISGGQMQRVAIARALLMNPSIIMADEPTGNLDTKTAHEIMDLIVKVHNQGNTILLITHEEDIAAFAQRHIKLLDGEIVHNKKQLKQENK